MIDYETGGRPPRRHASARKTVASTCMLVLVPLLLLSLLALGACSALEDTTAQQEAQANGAGQQQPQSTDETEASTAVGITYTPDYRYADLDTGIRIAYVELGDPSAPPVLFLHGATDSYLSWSQIAPRVADAGYHVIVPELRGHGRSDKPEAGPYTVESHSADIDALLAQLDVEQAHVVGHSLGTFVAQSLAAERPDRVKSLTLIGSAATVEGNPTLDWLLNGDGEWPGINNEQELSDEFLVDWTLSTNGDPAFIEATYQHAKALPVYVWRNIFNGLDGPAADLSKIAVPTQVIWGTEDGFFSRDDEDALISGLGTNPAEVEFIEKPGAGHNTHWEEHADEEISADILRFIDGA
ncbi:MAG: alpha/beta hydrolase [Coriobacteriales bacterium]|nr:alpha/beta hydrolase [Coriobacteriales bacterium]